MDTKEHTGGVLSLPFPLLVIIRVGTLGMGGAALLPQPLPAVPVLPGLVSNRGREELLPLSWEPLLALGTWIYCFKQVGV